MVVAGIVATVHIFNDLGVVCLIGTKTVPMALGWTLDILLDIFLILRAYHLFHKSDEDTRPTEFVVLASTIALISWHFVIPHFTNLATDGRVLFHCTSESDQRERALFHIASLLVFSHVSHL